MIVKNRLPPRSQTPKPSFVPRLRLFPFIRRLPVTHADYGVTCGRCQIAAFSIACEERSAPLGRWAATIDTVLRACVTVPG